MRQLCTRNADTLVLCSTFSAVQFHRARSGSPVGTAALARSTARPPRQGRRRTIFSRIAPALLRISPGGHPSPHECPLCPLETGNSVGWPCHPKPWRRMVEREGFEPISAAAGRSRRRRGPGVRPIFPAGKPMPRQGGDAKTGTDSWAIFGQPGKARSGEQE